MSWHTIIVKLNENQNPPQLNCDSGAETVSAGDLHRIVWTPDGSTIQRVDSVNFENAPAGWQPTQNPANPAQILLCFTPTNPSQDDITFHYSISATGSNSQFYTKDPRVVVKGSGS